MANVLRKLLVPALLALTSFALTSFALPSTAEASGTMCLSTDFGTTRIVSVQECDSRPGQHWTVNGESIYQSLNPGMCLATDYGRTRMVFVEGCNSSGPRQHWTVQGEQISLTF